MRRRSARRRGVVERAASAGRRRKRRSTPLAVEVGRERRVQRRGRRRRVPACRRAPRCGGRPAPALAAPSSAERGAHRGRVGVVALVDQRERRRPAPQRERARRGPSAGAKPASARPRPSSGRAEGSAREQHAERVHRPYAGPARRGGNRRARPRMSASTREPSRVRRAVDRAARRRRRARRSSSTRAGRRRSAAARRRSNCGVSRLRIGDAAGSSAGEDLGLGVGDRLDRAEMFDDGPARRW